MAKLHLIGNAHLDPVWLWRWQDGFSELLATYRSALDRMNDFPDFKFTSACAVYYQWIEKIDKKMFAEIQQRVKEGRWNIVGGWFLQPDCNIPCGESFARHGLVSQRYFKDRFGITAKTGYNVDSFGHNGSLPQILKKSGMDNYVFMRPGPHEKDMKESLFVWESADGSRVCTYRIPKMYALELAHLSVFEELRDRVNTENQDYMAFYGVGNHGGGPTIKLIDEINKLDIPNKVYSTPDEYFAGVDLEKLPVISDELQHHARGCYSVCTSVKTSNRKCENNLLAAEKFCVMAKYLAGVRYPKEKLDKAWKNLMFNQFHDILGGCCIKTAYEDAGYLFGETMSITEQAINFALQSMAHQIDTLGDTELPAYKKQKNWAVWEHEVLGTPIVVFNPHTWKVRMPVEINVVAAKMTDVHGNEIPYQRVRGEQTNGEDKYRTIFMAEVEPLGYAVYRVFAEKTGEAVFENQLSCTDQILENDCIRVEFSKTTGDISCFYDKRSEKYMIQKECRAILLDEIEADTWAHDKVYLGKETGMFGEPEFYVIEEGTVRTTLRVVTKYNNSRLQRDYVITPGSDVLTVKTKVDFHEKHKTVKFAFPIEVEAIIAKIPYGTISREKELGEEPCGSWFAAGNLCVANDSKYGYDTTSDEVRLTVLRSAIWADHFGVRDEFCEFMEQGIHEFSYSVFPYRNNCDAQKKAEELNFGLRAVKDSFHKGFLPEQHSCFSCASENIVVTAIKQGEDSEDAVIRFCEMNGKDENVSISLFDRTIDSAVGHNEIKTYKIDGTEVNLIEWSENNSYFDV